MRRRGRAPTPGRVPPAKRRRLLVAIVIGLCGLVATVVVVLSNASAFESGAHSILQAGELGAAGVASVAGTATAIMSGIGSFLVRGRVEGRKAGKRSTRVARGGAGCGRFEGLARWWEEMGAHIQSAAEDGVPVWRRSLMAIDLLRGGAVLLLTRGPAWLVAAIARRGA